MRKIEIEEGLLRSLYKEKGLSQQKVANYLNVTHSVVCARMRDYKLKARDRSETSRKYSINEHFWEAWNQESAWLYGWFVGDGFFIQPHGFGFHLQTRDRQVLEKFKLVLKAEHPIYDYGTPEIHFGSRKLSDGLRHLSYIDVPSSYLSDFTRGFFEAEGCVTWAKHYNRREGSGHTRTLFSQKDKAILEFIHAHLLRDKIVERGGLRHANRWDGWDLEFAGHDSAGLYHYLYDNCGDLYLSRKKQSFAELIGRQLP